MPDAPQMVIASRLRDGRAVFLAADDHWVTWIEQGLVARTPDEAGTLLAAAGRSAARNVVVDPYLITIAEAGDPIRRRPTAWREAVRASGPTVETRPAA